MATSIGTGTDTGADPVTAPDTAAVTFERLPIEILHMVAMDGESAYRAMLAVPLFARSLTPSRRVDFRIAFGHHVEITSTAITWTRNGVPHRLDGPAFDELGGYAWCRDGEFHRDARTTPPPPTREYPTFTDWWRNGQRHREDGPALIAESVRLEVSRGTGEMQRHRCTVEVWYRYGNYHREDDPAIVYSDGYREWRIDGVLHREDGPAVESPDGHQVWYHRGEFEQAFMVRDDVMTPVDKNETPLVTHMVCV